MKVQFFRMAFKIFCTDYLSLKKLQSYRNNVTARVQLRKWGSSSNILQILIRGAVLMLEYIDHIKYQYTLIECSNEHAQ